MRFAPPNPLRIADRASGLNALSVRSYNERLVLSLLLQNEGISRMEIGEKTGLSAQTASVIVRSLEQEGLVSQGEAQRGRVGPPTIPLSLNPEGAYAVGGGGSPPPRGQAHHPFKGPPGGPPPNHAGEAQTRAPKGA
ncbi:replication/maintenance protein RepL, partial [Mesorhizobium sp. M0518]|uniref:replication/maintenance protein RepL n=1 Tax=Mesorhizobium sp. M0518 TaxID=2956956 RepID=UPI00333BABA5